MRPLGFSLYHGYRNLLAERIHVRILGHAGRILRSFLHDICDHGIQACYHGRRGLRIHFLSRALFGYFNAKIFGLLWSTSHKFEVIVWCLPPMMKSSFYSCKKSNIFNFIGCATSAPDGSSPRGYSWIFYSSIGLVVSSSSILQCNR
jgi:hypothetical protein